LEASKKWTRQRGVFYEANARLKFDRLGSHFGIIFWLAPTLCQFQYPRWRHIGLFIARSFIAHPAKYPCSEGYLQYCKRTIKDGFNNN